MLEILESDWTLSTAGLLAGILLGGTARVSNFCTLSALERWWYSNDATGLRSWILAALVALIATTPLIYSSELNAENVFYLTTRINLINLVLGGLMFGLGMALVGTCGFGSLVRLGGGSLRSLIVILIMGMAALSAQRGTIGVLREWSENKFAFTLNTRSQAATDVLQTFGVTPMISVVLVVLCLLASFWWVASDSRFLGSKLAVFGGTAIGLIIAFGWYATSFLSKIQFQTVQLEAGSFVLPPGELIHRLVFLIDGLPDYGVGLVAGVVLGSAIVSSVRREVRWEACDDARELGRHLTGAILMGVGGVFASGCTIGQGISAFSVLAVSSPITIISVVIGARIGLAWLIEGSPLVFIRSR